VEMKDNPKPVDKGKKVDSLESRICKPKQTKQKHVAKVTTFKPAPTKVKQPGEGQVSRSVSKDRMTNGQGIKCGEKGHIKSDCTKGWKPAVTQPKGKGKAEVKVVAAKMLAIKATEDVAPAPVQYGQCHAARRIQRIPSGSPHRVGYGCALVLEHQRV